MNYRPSKAILDKYADVLINFALGNGQGIKKGEVVYLEVPEFAKPLLIALRNKILKAGGHPIINFIPDEMAREMYELSSDEQLDFFAHHHFKGKIDQADHIVFIVGESNKKELQGVDPKKIMKRIQAHKPYRQWRDEKENQGKYSWTLAAYGTESMAEEAGMSLEEYWNQIIKGCYLDYDEPIKKWKEAYKEIDRIRDALDNLNIKKIHLKSKDTDIAIGIGANRAWKAGSGCNISSFEIFTSPDCRIAEGKIRLNHPLYVYGNLIKDVFLEFKDGKVISSSAVEGQSVLREMIATECADRLGEFSLTDKRFSHITRFMAETLYDENIGGENGNTHIALGNAYKDCFKGDVSKVTKEQWKEMGYNESAVHTDIISTEARIVEAELEDGSKVVIYKDGMFTL